MMTHDELLAKIDSFSCCSGAHELALCAVVELHTPFSKFGYESCQECFDVEYSNKQQPYPCPTIQAIERVLE
jgi:hypothetical protein